MNVGCADGPAIVKTTKSASMTATKTIAGIATGPGLQLRVGIVFTATEPERKSHDGFKGSTTIPVRL